MTKQELSLIKSALLQVTSARVDKANALPDAPFEPSDSFNQKMQNLIQEHKEQQRRISIRKTVAIAIIAAIVLSLAACCIIYREEIKGFIVEMSDGSTRLKSDSSNTHQKFYKHTPSYLPSGYVLKTTNSGHNNTQSQWTNGQETLSLIQVHHQSGCISMDASDESYFEKQLNNTTLHCSIKNNYVVITWKDNTSIFTLNCPDDIPWDEIEKIILSLEIVE